MVNCFKHLRKNSFRASLDTMLLLRKVGPWAKLNGEGRRWLTLKYSFPTRTPFKLKIMCKGFTSTSFASTRGGDLKPLKMSSFPLFSLAVPCKTLQHHQIPQDANVAVTKPIVNKIQQTNLETESLDWAKVGLEMPSTSSVFLAFLHVFSNAIQSHQVVQVIE